MTEFPGLSTVLRQTASALAIAAQLAGSALNAVADSLEPAPAPPRPTRPAPPKPSAKQATRGRRPRA